MAIRFLSGERGGRALCVTLIFLIEAFTFALPVRAEEDFCRHFQNELARIKKELRYMQWNPPQALVAQRKDFEEKVREYCPCRPTEQAGREKIDRLAAGEYETKMPIEVRSGPGYHCNEISRLSRGTKITVEKSERGWLKVISKRGRPPGYIPQGAARPLVLARNTESTRSSSPPAARSASDGISETVIKTVNGRPSAVEHILAETDEAQAVSLSRSGGPGAWCRGGRSVNVKLRSTRQGVSLKQNYPTLVRSMLEKLKPVVEHGCPGAAAISIDLEKTRGYFATARKQAGGWVIAELMEDASPGRSVVSTPSPSLSGDTVRDCDTLAAHPYDPQRNGAQGVEDDAINPEKAIAACKAAVEQDPQNGRLLFQLGRSYWVGERFEEAIEAFLEAGDQEHSAALAYLGDAVLYGVAGMDPDPEEAKNLYQQAAAAGFLPAAALASEIVDGVEIAHEQEVGTGAEPEYRFAKTVKIIAGGDSACHSSFPQDECFIYMMSLTDGIRYHCPAIIPSENEIGDMASKLASRRRELAKVRQSLMAGNHFNLMQDGMNDGYSFAVVNGCQSRQMDNFVKTILRYFG